MTKEKMKDRISIIAYIGALWMLMLRQFSAMMPLVPRFSTIVYNYGDKMLWFAIAVLAIVITCNKPSIWDVFACIWSIVAVVISGNPMMMILVFLVVAIHRINIDTRKIVKAWILPVSVLMITVMVAYPILLMQGNPIAEPYDVTRWTFFFSHPNGFGLWFSFWILAVIYLCEEKMPRVGVCIVLFVASLFLVFFPQNKTGAIVLLAAIPLLLLEKYNRKLCKFVVHAVPIACIVVTIVLTIIYYKGILPCDQYILHSTFSMRFQDAAANLTVCPLNLWGQKVHHLGQDVELYGVVRREVSMDNGIVAALIYYGLIPGVLFIISFLRNMFAKIRVEDKKYRMQAILLVVAFVMGMMEWPAWYGTIGFPMLFLGDWIKNDKKKSEIT